MRKYKTINFLEKNKEEKKKNKLYIIVMTIITIYIGTKIYNSLNEIQTLKDYIEKNREYEIEAIPTISYQESDLINMQKVEEIYSKLGKSNIITFAISNSSIEIEGKCTDLNILNGINDYEYIDDMCVNKIQKEGDAYIFNVSYELID